MFAFWSTCGESQGTVYFLGSVSSLGIGPQPTLAPGLTVYAVLQENLLCLKDREVEKCQRNRARRADPENQRFLGTNGGCWHQADDCQLLPQPYNVPVPPGEEMEGRSKTVLDSIARKQNSAGLAIR